MPHIDPLTQSVEIHRPFKYSSHYKEANFAEKDNKSGLLLKKNKSNNHININEP